MAWNYGTRGSSAFKPEWDDDRNKIVPFPENPKDDYSDYQDQSEYKDHSSPDSSDKIVKQSTNTKRSLAEAEQNTTGTGSNKSRDIGKQERAAQWISRFSELENKRESAITASKNKQSGFFARHKKGVTGWLIGLVLAGGMSIFALPGIAIAELGQIANWIENTTQTIKELATGARSMRNAMVSAKYAARTAIRGAVKGTIAGHFQTSRAGLYGSMVGDGFLNQLSKNGFDVSFDTTGRLDGITIDPGRTSTTGDPKTTPRNTSFDNLSAENQMKYAQSKYPDLPPDRISIVDGPNGGKAIRANVNSTMELSAFHGTMRTANQVTGGSKFRLGNWFKIRHTARMLGVYGRFHPLQRLQEKGYQRLKEMWNRHKAERSGKTTAEINAKKDYDGQENETDDSKTRQQQLDSTKDAASVRAADGPPKISSGAKFRASVGKAAGITGLVVLGLCSIRAAGDALLENMSSLIETMSGIYQDTVSMWGQVQSAVMGLDGGAVDMDMLRVLHEDLYDDKVLDQYELDDNGYVDYSKEVTYTTKSWTGSPAYQATANGNEVSRDRVPPQVASMYDENGGWAAQLSQFLQDIPLVEPALDAVCSEFGQWLLTAVGAVADPVGTIVMELLVRIPAVSEAMSGLIAFVFQIGSGIILDDSTLDPDQRAEVAYRAGEYVSNAAFASMGGTVSDSGQAYENQLMAQEYLDAEWRSRPLAARLFDATDYRSTVARVVNNAGINTMPSNVGDYFANFARLIGAVPGFISGGLFGGRSAEARAAESINYDTGSPKIQFDSGFLQELATGGADANDDGAGDWDYDVNAGKVFDLLEGADGAKYREYAKTCLGLEIGPAPDFAVKSVESKELLPGFEHVGTWKDPECTDNRSNDDYKRVAVYAGLDYPTLAGSAWHGTDSENAEAKKIATEFGLDSGSGGGSNGSLKQGGLTLDEAKAFFQPYVDHTYTPVPYGTTCGGPPTIPWANCSTVPTWFVNGFTTLNTHVTSNGNNSASTIISENPDKGLKLSKDPSPYSVMQIENHTWVVVGVTADKLIILEAGCGMGDEFTAAKEVPLDYTGLKNGNPANREFVDISEYIKI